VFWPQERWHAVAACQSLTVLFGTPHSSEPSFRRAPCSLAICCIRLAYRPDRPAPRHDRMVVVAAGLTDGQHCSCRHGRVMPRV
jgi:hypothetical protein